MSRPTVSVVMPFAGTATEAARAMGTLAGLGGGPGDELILVDNAGTAGPPPAGVLVVDAAAERSPAHARNVGAERASGDWILFLDADTEAPAGLIDRYFTRPVPDDVGALAGGIVAAPDATGLAQRYGAARSFLDVGAHLAHPYLPRAASANLLVRRAAFTAVGGFHEGVRAAEDTDFSWRLQRAGWRLQGCPDAQVVHRYRATIGGLRRQWRGYAAGRAWLGRRYEDFTPEPALVRAAGRLLRRRSARPAPMSTPARASTPASGRLTRGGFLALDVLLGLEELAGFALSNRPRRAAATDHPGAAWVDVVLVADRFPAAGDPLVDRALGVGRVRVEAAARPPAPDRPASRRLRIDYREDDGAAGRAVSLAGLLAAHPLRAVGDVARRRPGDPPLRALAPVVRRVHRDGAAVVLQALGGAPASTTARRLAALTGRSLR